MKHTVAVINTCCLGPAAEGVSSGHQPYANRLWLMRNVILPLYTRWIPDLFQQVIVAGEFEEGEGYTYVPCPSVYRSCVDALAQRQAGFEAVTNKARCGWVLFQHDDHLWDPMNALWAPPSADVLSPSRWTHGRSTGDEQLPDGTYPDTWLSYLSGHACLMRPNVFQRGFSWRDVDPVFTWDVSATALLQSLEIPLAYEPSLKVWDMEKGATPWR